MEDLTRHRGLAVSVVRKMLGWGTWHPDFEDAIQECYLAWWRERGKYEPGRGWKWSVWAMRVAQYTLRQFGRLSRRRGLTYVGDRARNPPTIKFESVPETYF